MLANSSSVSRRNPCRRPSSNSGNSIRSGLDALQVPQLQPLAGEVGDQRLGARIGQHPAHLRRVHARVAQPALLRQAQQLVVRNAAPEEERQPRRQLQVAEPVGGVRPRPAAGRARRGTGTPDPPGCGAAPAARRRRTCRAACGPGRSSRGGAADRSRRRPGPGTRGARASDTNAPWRRRARSAAGGRAGR